MSKEQEIQKLKEKLDSIRTKIRAELSRIQELSSKIRTAYRHRDRAKYEAERKTILDNLKQYELEHDDVEKKLAELEVTP